MLRCFVVIGPLSRSLGFYVAGKNYPGTLEAQLGQDAPEDESLSLRRHSVRGLRETAAHEFDCPYLAEC